MRSLILQTVTRGLVVLLFMAAVVLVLRGHDEPGGGFIGGLVGAAAVALALMAFGAARMRPALPFQPLPLVGVGLAAALASGVLGLLSGAPLMTSRWAEVPLVFVEPLKVGTPLLFDVGVFLTVVGFTLVIVCAVEEEA